MTSTIDTSAKRRDSMIMRVPRPTCGKAEKYKAVDLVMRLGGGRDPQSPKSRNPD